MDVLAQMRVNALAEEMSEANLGDSRLNKRLGSSAEMMARAPSNSFPRQARDIAELEAWYRFLSNEQISFAKILEPHAQQTAKRVLENDSKPVLAVHDTTCFQFSSYRTGLGQVNGRRYTSGFHAHCCLAVQAEGPRYPLGVLGAMLWRRKLPQNVETPEPTDDVLGTLDNESCKWLRLVEQVEERAEQDQIVHVMDRGADKYDHLARLSMDKRRFVMRANQNRCVDAKCNAEDRLKLFDVLEEAEVVAERTIHLSARDQTGRPPSAEKVHPSRSSRQATVEIRACPVTLRATRYASSQMPDTVDLYAVWVREVDAPKGAEPVDWKLWTSEKTTEAQRAQQVVDWYRRRWIIEEYFGALKGGCEIEERQLASAKTLSCALAVMMPIAWRLLGLRTVARHAPKTPASDWMRATQLRSIAAHSRTDVEVENLDDLTVQQVFDAIARLGGHLPRNGPPGWQILKRGYCELMGLEIGYIKGRCETLDEVKAKIDELSPRELKNWLNNRQDLLEQIDL